MTSSVFCVAIDCADPQRLAEFWAAALDYRADVQEDPDEVWLEPVGGSGPALMLVRVPDPKVGKNRLHLDLNPDDQDAELRRLLGLGAKRVDVGQRDVSWIVMADPEGNEFCVLTAR
jgi:predicted enzyme related to lactoylglutathione lyase